MQPGELRLIDDLLQVGDLRGFNTFSLDGEFVVRNVLPPFVSWRLFPSVSRRLRRTLNGRRRLLREVSGETACLRLRGSDESVRR